MAKDKKVGSDKLSKATTDMVKLLDLFSPANRQKIIHASLTLLGENEAPDRGRGTDPDAHPKDDDASKRSNAGDLSSKAEAWVRQNALTNDQLHHVFEMDGGTVTLIANEIPGKSKKEKTIAVYVLQGIVQLLATGEPTFDDKAARKLCEHYGCFDRPNHAGYFKGLKNLVLGTKKDGWKVTAPGLKKGAEYIKEIANGA